MKIYVAGHSGMVGSAIVRKIEADGIHTWVGKTRAELDLTDSAAVKQYVSKENPDAVIIAAAKVGGILANINDPVGFLNQNLKMQTSLIEAAHQNKVPKLIFLGSSCIYPKYASQPIKEEFLLTGPLESTNKSYSLAKITGIQMVNSYRQQFGHKWISLMPTNLYGPNDNFDPETSHVIPALIDKAIFAKSSLSEVLEAWGTGRPLREFLHVDDLASAILLVLSHDDVPYSMINIGSGEERSIDELARQIAIEAGFVGEIVFDETKPDGVMRKLLDSHKVRSLGWSPRIDLAQGLRESVSSRASELGIEI